MKVKWEQFHFVWLFVVWADEPCFSPRGQPSTSYRWLLQLALTEVHGLLFVFSHLKCKKKKKTLLFVDRVHAFSVSWLSMKNRWHFSLSQCQSLSIWKTELPHREAEVTWVSILWQLSMTYLDTSLAHLGPVWRFSPLANLGVHTVTSPAHSPQRQGK